MDGCVYFRFYIRYKFLIFATYYSLLQTFCSPHSTVLIVHAIEQIHLAHFDLKDLFQLFPIICKFCKKICNKTYPSVLVLIGELTAYLELIRKTCNSYENSAEWWPSRRSSVVSHSVERIADFLSLQEPRPSAHLWTGADHYTFVWMVSTWAVLGDWKQNQSAAWCGFNIARANMNFNSCVLVHLNAP